MIQYEISQNILTGDLFLQQKKSLNSRYPIETLLYHKFVFFYERVKLLFHSIENQHLKNKMLVFFF